MDNNTSQNSVNFLDISNDINEFNNYNYYYPNNFQETTIVNQAAVQLSNVSCDNFNCSYEEPNDNIMPASYVNEQFSSQYTPQYIDQNVNERILDRDSPQYDINYPQKNYRQFPELKFEIPGYKIIIIPTFPLNLDNLDMQNHDQNDQNYQNYQNYNHSSNIVIDDLPPQNQQYQHFQQQNSSFELNESFNYS
ncbi:hypothetical protein RhiirA1_456658 [Rhizophagus irregularis]|uniref:Uncharacterized protein n=1 Tax=Rhizophagus irregularis TaxID=588596 RepID=A0A2I1EIE9_9GLOM|nr:hypothetical protein RhiirA1_456658 [Rhizophagus irregularis]PKY21895.1 hypothetical protein RhiirB3_435637 [Rhizophagus irregularis]CAB4488826.1 unnamed protein product [Rhizophagus irregularis]CAB5379580.1 unnamed protein product [Rhizophagus irregularis]